MDTIHQLDREKPGERDPRGLPPVLLVCVIILVGCFQQSPRTVQGRTAEQWLATLTTDQMASEAPLQLRLIKIEGRSRFTFELPIAFDSLGDNRPPGFLRG